MAPSDLAGRAAEVRVLLEMVEDALRGRARALFVSGEAGIGKTALVRRAEEVLGDKIVVRWIRCLPLSALATPLLPVRSALTGPLPDDGFAAMRAVDEWLARSPTLLVVDDVQWADGATLDLLMYLLAGEPDRRLAVALTIRSGAGAPTEDWLGEVRRLPGVAELALPRLDREATGEQVAMAVGGLPRESLIDDVYARSGGNPYLTSLLLRGVDPDAAVLPAGLPGELQDALGARCGRLSPAALELTTMVAVAGRPQRSVDLVRAGFRPPVLPALREAVDERVLVVDQQERYWFAHPLMAEVLRRRLLPEERRVLHAAFAVAADDPVAVADHYFLADQPEPAYRAALTAAAGAPPDIAVRLLRRAVDLAPGSVVVLRRLAEAAAAAGRDSEECVAVTALLARLHDDRDRAEMARILVRRSRLATALGGRPGPADAAAAVRLTAAADPAVHALALAELARAEFWHGDPHAAEHARAALALAETLYAASPDPPVRSALAAALVSDVMVRLSADDHECRDEAMRAIELAASVDDQWTMVHAAAWAANTFDVVATAESVRLFRDVRQRAVDAGAPASYLTRYSAFEAGGLLDLGDWHECAQRIREVLSTRPGPLAESAVRLTAAQLACRQGRTDDARRHLARAGEIADVVSPTRPFDATRAEVAVAAGDCAGVLAAVESGFARPVLPTQVERLVPLAARALADRIQASRDRGDDPAADLDLLADLRRRHPVVGAERGGRSRYRAMVRAMQAWYDAEAARAEGAGAADRWRRAADACAAAELPWDEAYCRRWQADASAAAGRIDRAALRAAYDLARVLDARPLVAAAEELARVTRVRLGPEPALSQRPEEVIAGLTAREAEVLELLVSGQTYAEIAARLVISEKTVGTHVSNMLRKTGTTNRVALAQLAERLSARRGHSPPVR